MQHNQHEPALSQEEPGFVTLKEAEQDVGITRVSLRKYLRQLSIEPRSFHIGNRSLYISTEEL
jgi:response regulator of citrate/malate metabolism